jgi:hypothetical protein
MNAGSGWQFTPAAFRHKKSVALNYRGHAFLIMRTRVLQKD